MDLHFTDFKQRHIRINGRQVNLSKPLQHQRVFQPFQNNSKPESVKFNNSYDQTFRFQRPNNPSHFDFFSPSKDIKFCIKPKSTKIQGENIKKDQKNPYFLMLQSTRPQSISEYEARQTIKTDFSLGQAFCVFPKKYCQTKRLRNTQALTPSLKPRTFSMNAQRSTKEPLQQFLKDENELHQLMQEKLGIEKYLKLLKKGEVTSYEEVDPPIQPQNRQESNLNFFHFNNKKDEHINKTSFDQQVLLSEYWIEKKKNEKQSQSNKFNSELNGEFIQQQETLQKQTLYSHNLSNSYTENHNFCQKLENEFSKEHNKTNSSVSLQEFDPVYQRQRQILIKYLESIKIQDNFGENFSKSNIEQDESNEQTEQQTKQISFMEFVNQLEQLKQQKKILQESSTQPKEWLQNLVKIGQNTQEIYDNCMIIHVLSISLKEMGFLQQKTKFHVIHNIKKLLLNALNMSQQKSTQQHTIELKLQSFCRKPQYSQENRLNFTLIQGQEKNVDSLRRYSFDQQKNRTSCGNAFTLQQNYENIFKQSYNYNCGPNATHLKRSHHTYLFRSGFPSNFENQKQSIQVDQKQTSMESIITKIYESMYHKIVPVELQLTVLFHLCKRGWKFFELLTAKILKEIYLLNKKDEESKSMQQNLFFQSNQIDKKIEKIIRESVDQ